MCVCVHAHNYFDIPVVVLGDTAQQALHLGSGFLLPRLTGCQGRMLLVGQHVVLLDQQLLLLLLDVLLDVLLPGVLLLPVLQVLLLLLLLPTLELLQLLHQECRV